MNKIVIAYAMIFALPMCCFAQSQVDVSMYSLDDVRFKEVSSSGYLTHLMHDADSGYYLLIGNDEDETAIVKLDSAFRVQSQIPFSIPEMDSIDNKSRNSYDATYSIGDTLYLFKSFKTPYSTKSNGLLLVCYLYVAVNNSIDARVIASEYSVSAGGYYVVGLNENSKTFGVCYFEQKAYKKPQTLSVIAFDRNLSRKANAKFMTDLTEFSSVSEVLVDDSSNVYMVAQTVLPKTKGLSNRNVIAAIKCNPFRNSFQKLIVDSSEYDSRLVNIKLIDTMFFVGTINGEVQTHSHQMAGSSTSIGGTTVRTSGSTMHSIDIDSKTLGLTMISSEKFELINYVPFDLSKLDKKTEEIWNFSGLTYNKSNNDVLVIYNKSPGIFNKDKVFVFKYSLASDSVGWIKEIQSDPKRSIKPSTGSGSAAFKRHHLLISSNDGSNYVLPARFNSNPDAKISQPLENTSAAVDTAYRIESEKIIPLSVITRSRERDEISIDDYEQTYSYNDSYLIFGMAHANNRLEKETKHLHILKISLR